MTYTESPLYLLAFIAKLLFALVTNKETHNWQGCRE